MSRQSYLDILGIAYIKDMIWLALVIFHKKKGINIFGVCIGMQMKIKKILCIIINLWPKLKKKIEVVKI